MGTPDAAAPDGAEDVTEAPADGDAVASGLVIDGVGEAAGADGVREGVDLVR
jgi:hypothetical protein